MYELVNKILDRAKEENVDVGIAYDMLGNENGYTEELKAAKKILDDNFEKITALRVQGKEDEIKHICEKKTIFRPQM